MRASASWIGRPSSTAEIGKYELESPLASAIMSGVMPTVSAPEPLAGAAEPADDLVGQHQDVVAAQHRLHLGEVARGRHDDAAARVDRLGDEGGDGVGALRLDHVLQLGGEAGGEGVGVSPGRVPW